jgi:hypothetical protein
MARELDLYLVRPVSSCIGLESPGLACSMSVSNAGNSS